MRSNCLRCREQLQVLVEVKQWQDSVCPSIVTYLNRDSDLKIRCYGLTIFIQYLSALYSHSPKQSATSKLCTRNSFLLHADPYTIPPECLCGDYTLVVETHEPLICWAVHLTPLFKTPVIMFLYIYTYTYLSVSIHILINISASGAG